MQDRKKALELFAKQMEQGNPLTEDFLRPGVEVPNKWNEERIITKRALEARDLAGDSLAHQVLKNTGIPVPDNNATRLKKEDFLHRLIKERYPELKTDINLGLMLDDSTPEGIYSPDSKSIHVKNLPDIIKNTSTTLHEAAHQYDMDKLKFDGTNDVNYKDLEKNVPKGRVVRDLDPTQAYEILSKGHHAEIPKLREGSFEFGALKSMMKNGKFKSIAGALPYVGGAVTAATALSSPDASAAVGDILVPGGLQGLGPSSEDAAIENPQANPELRKQALQKLMNK